MWTNRWIMEEEINWFLDCELCLYINQHHKYLSTKRGQSRNIEYISYWFKLVRFKVIRCFLISWYRNTRYCQIYGGDFFDKLYDLFTNLLYYYVSEMTVCKNNGTDCRERNWMQRKQINDTDALLCPSPRYVFKYLLAGFASIAAR